MASIFNGGINISIFGESHGEAIGVVIDNLPAGEKLDIEQIMAFMARRAPKFGDPSSTQRKEPDIPKIISGYYNGYTTGTPLTCIIENTGQHSKDYTKMSEYARPGHADYSGNVRYNGFNDIRGGGHFSGRLTAPLVFAGAVAEQILERKGIYSGAHIYSISDVKDKPFDDVNISKDDILLIKSKKFPTVDDNAGIKMTEKVKQAKSNGDSIGGIVECCIVGLPAGVGSPIFDGIENIIATLIFAVPAIKGLEFGTGFDTAKMTGSQCNDEMYINNKNEIKSRTNNNGGILGGISTGMPILFKAAVKPTPSITKTQKTINFKTKENAEISVTGRHDACILPRVVPVIEAVANIAVLSLVV